MAWKIVELKQVLKFYRRKSRGWFTNKAVKKEYAVKAAQLSALIKELSTMSVQYQNFALRALATELARMYFELKGRIDFSASEIAEMRVQLRTIKQKLHSK